MLHHQAQLYVWAMPTIVCSMHIGVAILSAAGLTIIILASSKNTKGQPCSGFHIACTVPAVEAFFASQWCFLHAGKQGSLLEKLTQLVVSLNPMRIVSWILNRLSGPGAQYSQRDRDPPARLQSEEQASGSGTARQNAYSQAMKRKNAEARKVHTVHDNTDQEGEGDDPDGNSYWNGNSTKFDADDK